MGRHLPQSYWMSLRSGKWVLMLHWMRCRLRVSGVSCVDRAEENTACLWLSEGGGWQQCMVMGAASTGGITKVKLGAAGAHTWHGVSETAFGWSRKSDGWINPESLQSKLKSG